ncbi:MAG TPA: tetratricopeptide repeat protein [Thermoanaerobaculia bacterium]|nr:tetratricopeptide repeat protein [Thermoanaerobaculia bacterium]
MAAFLAIALAMQVSTVLNRVTELAQKNDLAGAERVAVEAVRQAPSSRDAQLALARVYLWEGRYREAVKLFAALVARNPRDNDARRGLEQIRAQSRSGYVVDAGFIDDDQPEQSLMPAATVYGFFDPLTKWLLSASEAHLHTDLGDGDSESLHGDLSTFLPRQKIALEGGLGWTRFPDGTSRLMPEATIARDKFSLSFDRRALLRSAPAVHSHPFADVTTVRWTPSVNASFSASHFRYFDQNSGNSADGYWLVPMRSFLLGASAAYRDTKESRFVNGTYDPYWTPIGEREGRAIAAVTWKRVNLHVDAGVAYDRITGTFHPWRVTASTSFPLANGATLNVSAERSRTAFYTANEIHASVAGRF